MKETLTADSAPIRLQDYRPPAWRVERLELECDLDIERSEVLARLHLRRDATVADTPLRLDGEGLELIAISLDGEPLASDAYVYRNGQLEVHGARDGSVLETRVALYPAQNTALEGLYLSGSREQGFLLTQCEAQGFRRISFFPDRPDVQARYHVTLRADAKRFPVLLAGGNPAGAGELADGRHWARFVDPHPKPSYLFALVAGRLEKISRQYRTVSGREVMLHIWAEAEAIDRCEYAMDALERSMRWDERAYGREYDLDVFHIVATHDFNMGAMENKGLNIFNAKFLLADPDSSTDEEYRHVESVVAHEYFHNWSGNRVTCRDWFQLSLKEGFTVFREQSFAADMNSAPLKRIEDVALLRRVQFAEDAGPLAHPVRPTEYREINNFYTATVYEKGAELVRMLAGRLGAEGFRRGCDRYFAANDGQAATIEDFLAALSEANGVDLEPYLAWYAQAGTPRVLARGEYDAANKRYRLTLSQSTPPTPGQSSPQPLPIPVRLALFGPDGQILPLRQQGQPATDACETVVELSAAQQVFVFEQVAVPPVPSLLRGFSAPVMLDSDAAPEALALLLRHDPDGFNRWDAGQQLIRRAYAGLRADEPAPAALAIWCKTLAALVEADTVEAALLAELLTPPGEAELAENESGADPERIHQLHQRLELALARQLGAAALQARYQTLAAANTAALDAAAQAQRRLKQRVLQLLAILEPKHACVLAAQQYRQTPAMSDRLAALAVLARYDAPQAAASLAHYRERYADNALALDKWFALQARLPGATALARVETLAGDLNFSLKNPNRVYALLGSYARSNPTGFHRIDGAGYRYLAQQLQALDALNPQVSSRLATAFNGWQRLEPRRREEARTAITALAAEPTLSRNLSEIVQRMLAAT